MDDESQRLQRMIRPFLIGSFIVELLLAEAWLRFARQSSLADLLQAPGWETSLALGIPLGFAIALATRLYFSRFATRLVWEMFVPLFGNASNTNVALLALMPAIGEEILFRGVIQAEIGLLAASLLFGLLHSGFSRQLLPYGVWSTAVGLMLGGLYLATGSLWGSIAAHALVNALDTLWVRRLASRAS